MGVFADAAIARIEATWPKGRVYKPRKVPDKPLTPYVIPYSDEGRGVVPMNDATAGLKAHRLMPMAVGATTDEVDRAISAVLDALEGQRLVADGRTSTPLWLESSGNYVDDPDGGGLLTKTLFLTFNATAQENA